MTDTTNVLSEVITSVTRTIGVIAHDTGPPGAPEIRAAPNAAV